MYLARTSVRDGETYDAAYARLRNWADAVPVPDGTRIGLEAIEEYDDDTLKSRRTGVRTFLLTGPPVITTDDVVDAAASVDTASARESAYVAVTLSPDAAERFRLATREYTDRRIAIIVNGVIESAPIVRSEIRGGRVSIKDGELSVIDGPRGAARAGQGAGEEPRRARHERTLNVFAGDRAQDQGARIVRRMNDLASIEAKQRVAAAVTAIETKTSAEIVVMMRPDSGSYRQADLVAGAIAAFAYLCIFLYAPEPFDFTYFPLEQAACTGRSFAAPADRRRHAPTAPARAAAPRSQASTWPARAPTATLRSRAASSIGSSHASSKTRSTKRPHECEHDHGCSGNARVAVDEGVPLRRLAVQVIGA